MKLELFKPELYLTTKEGMMDARSAALQSQAMLNEYIESLPLVWGPKKDGDEFNRFSMNKGNHDKFQARLICIEPIEKKEDCYHKSPYINQDNMAMDIHTQRGARHLKHGEIVCLNCGKKLKAKWEVDNG